MAIWGGGGGFSPLFAARSSGSSYPVWDGTGWRYTSPWRWLEEDKHWILLAKRRPLLFRNPLAASIGINPYLFVAARPSSHTWFQFQMSVHSAPSCSSPQAQVPQVSSRAPWFRISRRYSSLSSWFWEFSSSKIFSARCVRICAPGLVLSSV